MNQSKISVRYAKALLISAKNSGVLQDVYSGMSTLFQLFSDHTELKEVFANPTIKPSLKVRIIKDITASMNHLVQSFAILVIENDREQYFQNICRDFISFYKTEMGIKTAQLTTVAPLSAKNTESVRKLLASHFNASIEFTNKFDESLIGGFIVQVDDLQIDTSIKAQLENIKRNLTNDSYKSKL
ncbi:MAG TPA: ATP synthase F1 subunit delta [Bacteroidales bacterium]|nr:ATP synthase F1 subunit delta [Bacteroidales bacterium]HQL69788.1 ATP synthase F1 subunit delta [Bacteroidales bacterium]